MIRPIAICVLRCGDEILVFEARDEKRDLTYYRPLGGGRHGVLAALPAGLLEYLRGL